MLGNTRHVHFVGIGGIGMSGIAELLLQRDLRGAVLAARVLALAGDRARRERMSVAARSLARPDAARVIVDRALALARM